MRTARRIAIVAISIGWIAPLCLSFWAVYSMIEITWRKISERVDLMGSWHPFWAADELFYFAMLWLGAVIVGWVLALTRNQNGS